MLIADDSPKFLDTAGRVLGADPRFHVVGQVHSGEEVLGAIPRLRPHVVLMDLAMPGMGGLAATRFVKAMPDPPYVLALTLHDAPEYRAAAAAVGMDGFIGKQGFSVDVLHGMMAGHLAKIRQGQAP